MGYSVGLDKRCVYAYRLTMTPKSRHNMFIDNVQWNALLSLAKKTGLSVAELVRRAIDSFLKDHK